ncbi:phytanoyl-CoA dioxygenase family protein [Hyalangium versicolor]|uniref:phytanoyl-CoA dioxygenase family protein n=1 Tax=Hyalangium versicolor TaxID=2861190 RepID=UPI001CCE3F52|nr:phytanoyl-CoA dioxygenase family protein [Hyalangium versicolor]
MELKRSQVEQYEQQGYLFLERVFSAREVAALDAIIPELLAVKNFSGLRRCDVTGQVRHIHGTHLYNEQIRKLARHPRLLQPSEQLLGGKVYVHQSRLVPKLGLAGPARGFPWHQDFPTWHVRDGMPGPRAVVVAVFVDEVTAFNGPILFIPRSHHLGMMTTDDGPVMEGYKQLNVSDEQVTQLFKAEGMVAQLGAPGSVLFMHSNLVHASSENISPLRRAMHQLVYNSVENMCTNPVRPEEDAARDGTPLEALSGDCLLEGNRPRPEA